MLCAPFCRQAAKVTFPYDGFGQPTNVKVTHNGGYALVTDTSTSGIGSVACITFRRQAAAHADRKDAADAHTTLKAESKALLDLDDLTKSLEAQCSVSS